MADYFQPAVAVPQTSNYAAPLLNFAPVGNLLTDYYQGTQMGRTRALQTAFQGGLPKNSDGSLNIPQMTDTLARLGGADAASSLMKMQFDREMASLGANGIANANNGVQPGGSVSQGASAVPGSQPAPLPANGAPNQGAAPTMAAPKGDAGTNTIMSVVAGQVGDENAGKAAIKIAGLLKIDPNQPLTPQQMTAVQNAMKVPGVIGASQEQPAPAIQPASQPSPSPEQTTQPQASDAQPPVQTIQAVRDNGGVRGMTESTAVNLNNAAANLRARAAAISAVNPKIADQLKSQADSYDDRAKQIRDFINRSSEPTNEQKNYQFDQSHNGGLVDYQARASGAQKGASTFAEAGAKDYDAIRKLGAASVPGMQKMQLMASLANDPSFYSGIGAGAVQKYKQLQSALGNPKAAATVEGFNKEANNVLNENIKALGGSGVGQVRVAEIKIMQQGNANLGITPWTNRGIIEQNRRIYQDNINVAKLAADYREQHGNLDQGFDRQVIKYYQDHPLFTRQELENPRLIGAPTIAGNTPGQVQAEVRRFGLKPGDPFKTSTGQYLWVPKNG